jgi:outer membrane protein assembly factor BamB
MPAGDDPCWGYSMRRTAALLTALLAGCLVVALVASSGAAVASRWTGYLHLHGGPHQADKSAAASGITIQDWSAYLHDAQHSSTSSTQTQITPANAATLSQRWKFTGDAATMSGQPGPGLFSSPTVADGSIYVGANNGYFYQLNATTGAVQHKVFIGFRKKLSSCSARGFIGTATVAPDPVTGVDTVYIGAPDSKLYAFNASDLSLKWSSVIDTPSPTVNDYFQWSSPTVANGKIYIGSASHCDKPLTRGAVVGFNQATGAEFARWFAVPSGILGGGVWSSVAVDSDGFVYATTGTQPKNTTNRYDAVSIVKLSGDTLTRVGKYTVPDSELGGDSDFGSSPTVAGPDIVACNKNGLLYALNRATMQLHWHVRIGAKSNSDTPAQCSAAAIYDGTYLYMAGNGTTINGVTYRGSIRRLDPATGAFLWQRGLPNSVIGSPSLNGGGLIGVGTYDPGAAAGQPNASYLINRDTGAMVRTMESGGNYFSQPVFANGWFYTARTGGLLKAWALP